MRKWNLCRNSENESDRFPLYLVIRQERVGNATMVVYHAPSPAKKILPPKVFILAHFEATVILTVANPLPRDDISHKFNMGRL